MRPLRSWRYSPRLNCVPAHGRLGSGHRSGCARLLSGPRGVGGLSLARRGGSRRTRGGTGSGNFRDCAGTGARGSRDARRLRAASRTAAWARSGRPARHSDRRRVVHGGSRTARPGAVLGRSARPDAGLERGHRRGIRGWLRQRRRRRPGPGRPDACPRAAGRARSRACHHPGGPQRRGRAAMAGAAAGPAGHRLHPRRGAARADRAAHGLHQPVAVPPSGALSGGRRDRDRRDRRRPGCDHHGPAHGALELRAL